MKRTGPRATRPRLVPPRRAPTARTGALGCAVPRAIARGCTRGPRRGRAAPAPRWRGRARAARRSQRRTAHTNERARPPAPAGQWRFAPRAVRVRFRHTSCVRPVQVRGQCAHQPPPGLAHALARGRFGGAEHAGRRQRAPRIEERFLREVVGGVCVAAPPREPRAHRGPVPVYQFGERRPVAGRGARTRARDRSPRHPFDTHPRQMRRAGPCEQNTEDGAQFYHIVRCDSERGWIVSDRQIRKYVARALRQAAVPETHANRGPAPRAVLIAASSCEKVRVEAREESYPARKRTTRDSPTKTALLERSGAESGALPP